ncbi:2Fe-2S iron-sulfur cluster-binding protein [bacterium]|nr:2Fe-2S iron-sulfur cluster-binding protein [bacterium]
MIVDINVNGEMRHLQARSGDRLVDVLRDRLSIASLLPDCLSGRCGRCFVFLDGRLVQSCLLPAFKAKGARVVTFEGIADSPEVAEIEEALRQAGALPCPFCRTAKIMAIVDLLERHPLPDEKAAMEQLDMVSCACTDPISLIKAIGLAADARSKRKFNRANK